MRILFALPGFHRYDRGAEIALMAVATELANTGDTVTLIGAGEPRPDTPYRYIQAPAIRRERFEAFPSLPALRNNTAYEEATFAPGLAARFRAADYDLTVTCAYPFTNWTLRRPTMGHHPRHVFVTQNGDWPAYSGKSEYRFFGCDGLVCINPDYFERNRERWNSALIPNGMDPARFSPGPATREAFGLPIDKPVVLMVSALIPSKRVDVGIRAVAQIPGVHLVDAGDGPMRDEVDRLANDLMPGRFSRISVTPDRMPSLYRSADVFLHLSKDESFGNVYVEAMACGLPIVAHDWPRTRWIVGDDEFLADSDDTGALVAAIQAALAAEGAGIEARLERAKRFAWANIATQYRDFFASIIR
ncbi:MAG: glycosyltransferase family 4 protein [Sphingomonadales bacterium]